MSVATVSTKPDAVGQKKPAAPRDSFREAIETIVFVVVLVLLLKLFVTEAFVIPTGSMAETLYGYQKVVECPKCGHEFPVNSHDEVEANMATGRRHRLIGYTCPNCRFPGQFPMDAEGRIDSPRNNSGDRVLVLKPIYHLQPPHRGDVVVFKYPEEPQQKQTAQNYIKRCMAFGGETAGIHRGDLYVTRSLDYPPDAKDEDGNPLYPRPEDPLDLWKPRYTYSNTLHYPNPDAEKFFEKSRTAGFPDGQGGFEIVRKTPEQVLACQRIVWDNDQQPRELAGKALPRWYAAPEAVAMWTGDNADLPHSFAHTDAGQHWLRYRHLVYPWDHPGDRTDLKPRPIDNFLGYNSGISEGIGGRDSGQEDRWVSDLILECEAELGAGAEVVLELSKGQSRFRATFAGGTVALSSTGPKAQEFGSRPCKVNGPGKYHLRFANVDCRLRVWVNEKLIDFGTEGDYLPGSTVPPGVMNSEGYTEENDVAAPASIGATGTVTVRAIRLHRDIYYTRSGFDHSGADLFYVQPGHYLCLGDNSAQSSDSRKWGTVPDRLMLGKAVFVFWPFSTDPAKNRIGFIK